MHVGTASDVDAAQRRAVGDVSVRIGEADRRATADALGRHYALGRLTTDELERRLEATFGATSGRELDAVVADLPSSPAGRGGRGRDIGMALHVLAYLVAVLSMWLIWVLTWTGHPWPIYPTLGWGSGLVSHALAARGVTGLGWSARCGAGWMFPRHRPVRAGG